MLKHLRRYVIAGLLVWLPLALTFWLLSFAVGIMDGWLDRVFALLPPSYHPDELLGISIPGLGVIFTLLLLITTGVFAANIVGRAFVRVWESLLDRIPIVRPVYSAIKSFAERKHIRLLNAELYNARDPFPMTNRFERFYTNPPWGQSNDGESVHIFMERGMEACGHGGQGMIVIADDEELEWPKRVLYTTQKRASELGYFVSRMQPLMHSYHLDDDALLRSCNLFVEALPGNRQPAESREVDKERLTNFYGRDQNLRMRYIRSSRPLTFEAADEDDWKPEFYEDTE